MSFLDRNWDIMMIIRDKAIAITEKGHCRCVLSFLCVLPKSVSECEWVMVVGSE